MGENKLVGQNYVTPDLVAKVTGRAKYAEDFRVDGMLYAKLLLSPLPHARVRSIDTSAAEAMPGVRAILRASELPAPADVVTDLGERIPANPKGERALSDEPVYAGEPVLAVAAVDEETAVAAIEAIEIDFEPLPFVVDPLVSLRPDGPDARTEGNCWGRPAGEPTAPLDVQKLKWASADFAEYEEGRLPTGTPQDEWSFGDVEAGFAEAALVLDETFSVANNIHNVLEPRSTLAYWRNGKLYVHTGTQSTVQTVASLARWMRLDIDDVVLITEYTGGGFGSRATGAVISTVPAVLARKAGQPVMLRISREEDHYIGGIRPAIHGRVRAGFANDGRLLALDMFCIGENSAYEPAGDAGFSGTIVSLLYQPQAMRMRATTVLTNTPPRRAQSQPGGLQGIVMMEPVIAKAARQLGLDQVDIRRVNAPVGKAPFGPQFGDAPRAYCTGSFLTEALDRGAELFDWETRIARSGQRTGSTVRGTGVGVSTFVAGSTGFDGLFVIKPDGRMYVKSGVGNLGTESYSDVHRVAAELMGVPWDKVEISWGDTSQNLPWTCVSGGSQTTHAMTRAAHAAASDAIAKTKEIAARTLGGSPESYNVADELRLERQPQHDARGGGPARHRVGRLVRRARAARGHQPVYHQLGDRTGWAGPHGRRTRQLRARRQDVLLRRRVRGGRGGPRDRRLPNTRLPGGGRLGHHHPPAILRRADSRALGARHGAHPRAEDPVRPALRPAIGDADVPESSTHDTGRTAKYAVGRGEHTGSRDPGRREGYRRAAGCRWGGRSPQRALRGTRR